MKIFYGVQIHGQGHLNRSAEMIRRLRERGHHVDVLTSGQTPPEYAERVLGKFEHVSMPVFALSDGRLDVVRSGKKALALVPTQLQKTTDLAKRLSKNKYDLLLSDFEPISSWAAGLAKLPSAGIAAQYRMTHTRAVRSGPLTKRLVPQLATRLCSLGLQRFFAVSFSPLQPLANKTTVVGPIVGPDVRELSPGDDGFFLAYLYSYSQERVIAALRGKTPFRVFGLGKRPPYENIQFCATSRESFLQQLSRCSGVVLNGSFQAVCEASTLGKPVLSIPFANHYEETFCAEQLASAGLGITQACLTREGISAFVCNPPLPQASILSDGADTILGELSL